MKIVHKNMTYDLDEILKEQAVLLVQELGSLDKEDEPALMVAFARAAGLQALIEISNTPPMITLEADVTGTPSQFFGKVIE
jgi:hypothetical protein